MSRTKTLALALLAGLAAAAAPALAAPPIGVAAGPHPDAPPQTAQFAFLIGEWDCTNRSLKFDASGYTESRAKWIGAWILDGWAIQDFWIGYGANGQEFHGTNVRNVDPRTGKWDNRWIAAGPLAWQYFSAEKVGDTMVMTGGEGTDPNGEYVDRNVFYDITADHWKWRKDRSYDGGKTWIEGVGHIEATRAGTAKPPAAEGKASAGAASGGG